MVAGHTVSKSRPAVIHLTIHGAAPSIWMRYGIIVSSQVGYELVKTHNPYGAFGLGKNIVKGFLILSLI